MGGELGDLTAGGAGDGDHAAAEPAHRQHLVHLAPGPGRQQPQEQRRQGQDRPGPAQPPGQDSSGG